MNPFITAYPNYDASGQSSNHFGADELKDAGEVGRRRDLAAFKAFLRICDKWQLKNRECRILLGDMPSATFNRLKSDVTKGKGSLSGQLSRDTLERISYILGIYKALHILLPAEQADHWVNQANRAPLFNGASALERMLQGNVMDLAVVRQYLDAERGWGSW